MSSVSIQEILNNAVAAERAGHMKTSPQLMLGELILKLDAIKDRGLPVVYDIVPYHPTDIDSWRGSYCELALSWTDLGQPLPLANFLGMLKNCLGATFTGYKGGDYVMGKTTPVWVANYGDSEGLDEEQEVGVVDVRQDAGHVVLVTEPCEL